MKKILFITILIFIFSGCTILNTQTNKVNKMTNFSKLSKNLTRNICSDISKNSTLYVTDFVNESNLKNISQLGFLLSNETKVNILKNSCTTNVNIKNFQLSKSLQIGKQGARILTRDLKNLKIKNLQDDKQILIGTYMLTSKQLILFLKLVDLKDGQTISTSSISTNITNEIKELEGIRTTPEETPIYQPFHL